MTYGELSKAIKKRFDDNVPAWHGMANPLGEIQDACKELDLPNLPVMVVDQAKMRPAAGWYIQFDSLYPELALLDNVEKRMGGQGQRARVRGLVIPLCALRYRGAVAQGLGRQGA